MGGGGSRNLKLLATWFIDGHLHGNGRANMPLLQFLANTFFFVPDQFDFILDKFDFVRQIQTKNFVSFKVVGSKNVKVGLHGIGRANMSLLESTSL